MFAPIVRIVLIIVCVVVSIVESRRGAASSWLCLVAAGLLVWGYFRYGTVWVAWKAMQTGQMSRGRQLLEGTRFPQLLAAQSRAYYEMARGMLAADGRDWVTARRHFVAALSGRLRTSNDRSLTACQLAVANAELGDVAEARKYLERARSEGHKPGVAALIESVTKQLGPAG